MAWVRQVRNSPNSKAANKGHNNSPWNPAKGLGEGPQRTGAGVRQCIGAIVHRCNNTQTMDKLRKKLITIFNRYNLKITVDTNLTKVDYLDITLDLNSGTHYPFRKPNEETVYINKHSNHPPSITKQIVKNVSTRISALSSNKVFSIGQHVIITKN